MKRNAYLARQRRRWSRGVSALEFALVSPLVFLVLFFAIEMGISLMADATLSRTAAHIARQGVLGNFASTNCETAVRMALGEGMSQWVYDEADLLVSTQVYPSGSAAPPAEADENYVPACNAGARGDLVVLKLGFSRTGFSGFMQMLGIKVLRFERTIIIHNEP